jgi:hypothetical protein
MRSARPSTNDGGTNDDGREGVRAEQREHRTRPTKRTINKGKGKGGEVARCLIDQMNATCPPVARRGLTGTGVGVVVDSSELVLEC